MPYFYILANALAGTGVNGRCLFRFSGWSYLPPAVSCPEKRGSWRLPPSEPSKTQKPYPDRKERFCTLS